MASARAMLERRRSSRVKTHIPVQIRHNGAEGEVFTTPGEAIGVSRTGALLRLPLSLDVGTRIEVLHGHSGETREFRVMRVRKASEAGMYELGVEIHYPNLNFWGIILPDDRRTA